MPARRSSNRSRDLERASPAPPGPGPVSAPGRATVLALAVILFALTVVLYLPALSRGFLYDDYLLILKADTPRSLSDLASLFTRQYYQGLTYYRPLTAASFLIQRGLVGDRPETFHLVNVLLAGVLAAATFALLSRPSWRIPPGLAAAGAAVFVWHPVVSSCVYPVSGRDTLLAILCVVGAADAFLRGTRRAYSLGLALFALGLLSKESAVITPVLVLIADRLGVSIPRPRSARAWTFRYAPMVAVLVAYLAMRLALFTGGDLHAGDPSSTPLTYLYMAQVTLAPFRELLYEPSPSAWLLLPRIAISGVLLVLLGIATARAWKTVRPSVLFWIGWLFVTQLPTANLLWQETRFDERYAAVSSLSFIAIAAIVASEQVRQRRARFAVTGAAWLLAALLALVGFGRGAYFEEVAFYRQWIRIKPGALTPHYNLANALSQRGQNDEAIREYEQALRIEPGNAQVHNNLGQTYAKTSHLDLAVRHFREAIRLDPRNAKAWNNLGSALALQGDLRGAAEQFREAVRLDPAYANALFDLGFALMELGDNVEAEARLTELLRREPGYAKARKPLAIVLLRQGKRQQAQMHLQEALKRDPADGETQRLLDESALSPRQSVPPDPRNRSSSAAKSTLKLVSDP